MTELTNKVAVPETYAAVKDDLDRTPLPVVWGKYSGSNVANARKYELTNSRHNADYGLKFTVRTMADGAYLFAYLTDEQLDTLVTTMTYEEWETLRRAYG